MPLAVMHAMEVYESLSCHKLPCRKIPPSIVLGDDAEDRNGVQSCPKDRQFSQSGECCKAADIRKMLAQPCWEKLAETTFRGA
jgi:hypothetical protein